jgi:SNF2 family DNA or RNA helicase
MSNQAAHYLQSLDRIHRRGQTRNVEYVILLCEKTLELDEYDRLTEKERAAQQLLGDRVDPPVTRQAMLRQAEDAARLLGLAQV